MSLHSNTGVLLAVTQSECTIVPSPCSTGSSFLFYSFLYLFCMLHVYFRQWVLLNCHACPFATLWVPAFLTSKAFFLVLQIFSSVVTFKFHNDFKRKTVYSYLCFKKNSTFEPLINKADFQSMQEEWFENPTPKKSSDASLTKQSIRAVNHDGSPFFYCIKFKIKNEQCTNVQMYKNKHLNMH